MGCCSNHARSITARTERLLGSAGTPTNASSSRRVRSSRWADVESAARLHLRAIRESYARAPYAEQHLEWLERLLIRERPETLSELNQATIEHVARLLGARTQFVRSTSMSLTGAREDRLLDLLSQLGATRYVSGPSARAYLHEDGFARLGIELAYKEYAYPEYPQLHGPFEHAVSVVDLLMNTGPRASSYVWGPA